MLICAPGNSWVKVNSIEGLGPISAAADWKGRHETTKTSQINAFMYFARIFCSFGNATMKILYNFLSAEHPEGFFEQPCSVRKPFGTVVWNEKNMI
jgi:hypothetical protein